MPAWVESYLDCRLMRIHQGVPDSSISQALANFIPKPSRVGLGVGRIDVSRDVLSLDPAHGIGLATVFVFKLGCFTASSIL